MTGGAAWLAGWLNPAAINIWVQDEKPETAPRDRKTGTQISSPGFLPLTLQSLRERDVRSSDGN